MLRVDGEHVKGAALHRLVEEVCRGEHWQRSHTQILHWTVQSELDKQSFVHIYEHFLQQLGVLKHIGEILATKLKNRFVSKHLEVQ